MYEKDFTLLSRNTIFLVTSDSHDRCVQMFVGFLEVFQTGSMPFHRLFQIVMTTLSGEASDDR